MKTGAGTLWPRTSNDLRTRSRLTIKKAGRFPVRGNEGPAKNLLSKRRRDAQQDTVTLWSLAGLFRFESKKQILKLGRFTDVFAEITIEMNLDPFSVGCGAGIHRQFIPIPRESQAGI